MKLHVAMVVAVIAACSAAQTQPARGAGVDVAGVPCAVWLQSPRNAEKYRAIGVNLYVGLWQGPTAAQLAGLKKTGMKVICEQNLEGLKPEWKGTIAGWMHGDEPDNAQALPGKKGWGPPVPPATILADYKRIKAADPRPVLLNLGQGVAWDGWIGRGVRTNKPEDYPEYVKGADVVSFDIYPAVHDHRDVAGKLEFVGRGTARLKGWAGSRPVWACLETTHIGNEKRKPTPDEVQSEAWMAIANGATGVIYFAHEFKPKFVEAGLLADSEIAAAVKRINADLQTVAPAILSGAPAPGVTLDLGTSAAGWARRVKGETVIVIAGMDATTRTVKVTVPASTSVEAVVGERPKVAGKTLSSVVSGYGVRVWRVKEQGAARQ